VGEIQNAISAAKSEFHVKKWDIPSKRDFKQNVEPSEIKQKVNPESGGEATLGIIAGPGSG
jgi:hypothetical protein